MTQYKREQINVFLVVVLFLSLFTQSLAAAPATVGQVTFARGSAAAQLSGQAPRLLGKGMDIYQGDNIQTADRSFVIVKFQDDSKITVRPNSSFSVTQFNLDGGELQAKMELHVGGIKGVTGKIAKASADNFEINTKQGKVTAQDAEYSVRLCQEDCQGENVALNKKKKQPVQPVAARVVEITGDAYAYQGEQINNGARKLEVGSPIYQADRVQSYENSFAVLVFRDGGRITVEPETQLLIKNYQYSQNDKQDQAVYKLVSGGLRVLTGSIGQNNKEAYKLDTTIATIGIRGTGFDLSCQGGCSGQPTTTEVANQVLNGKGSGLYSYVWDGAISQKNDAGVFELNEGSANYIQEAGIPPIDLPKVPTSIEQNKQPRPDKIEVDTNTLFSEASEEAPGGLYVMVHEGEVDVAKETTSETSETATEEKVTIAKDEASYVGNEAVVMLDEPQDFQTADPYPEPASFDQDEADQTRFSLLVESYEDDTQPGFECGI